MNKPEDTTKRDPSLHLAGSWNDPDRYITEMESAGQRQLVYSDRMPTEGPAEKLLELGFQLGDPDPSDPMFRPVTLPEGWTREGSDHAMWSYILDHNGRRRVAIFYKAAFYDRSAHFHIETVGGYVNSLLWGDEPMPDPIVDKWTTREALTEAIRKAQAREERDAVEQESYYPEGAASARDRVARCDRLLAALDEKS